MSLASRFAVCALGATLLLSGCSKSGPFGTALPVSQPTSAFPVYSPSTVDTIGKYDDSTDVTKLGSSFFGDGQYAAYPYIGTQELLKTSASLDTLEAWIRQLIKNPPEGLYPGTATPAPDDGQVNKPFVDAMTSFGLTPLELQSKDRRRAVMIIVLDPKLVAGRASAVMAIIDMYEKMPAPLRGGIEQSTKKMAGFSISDLTDTKTPLGMIIYAARTWKNQNARAIVLVDAERQPKPLPTPNNT